MANPCSIVTTVHAGVARIVLTGEIDLATAPTFAEHMGTPLADEGLTTVMVDLHNITFIDSDGIASLIRAKQRAQETGKTFRVVGVHGPTARAFEIGEVAAYLAGRDEPAVAAEES
jgi:anti-anti-sigma factor